MKKILLSLLAVGFLFLFSSEVQAERYRYEKSSSAQIKATAAGCKAGANFKWLEINNVRTRINTSGDMWWDFEIGQYEIPKGSKKTSMFAAALWIGGLDNQGQLKLAAQRFRQVGIDYFPGPLTVGGDNPASVTREVCEEYDKIFSISRAEVDEFLAYFQNPSAYPTYQIPESIRDYPAHGNEDKFQPRYLAPFKDVNGDGAYDPNDGDYPYYDLTNELCHTNIPTMEGNGILVDQVLKGDGTLWWVFNDKGDLHSESGGEPIGLEIRAQAFAFSTNDEINDMTFYSYEIINRSTYTLNNTYFSQWVDSEIGFAFDDYVGCDVIRGLGYCYNGRPVDGNNQVWTYGNNPPAIGVDFFQGPYLDPDGYDNPSFNPYSYDEGATFFGSCAIVEYDSTLQMVALNQSPSDSVLTLVNACAIDGVNFGNGIIDDERFGMRRFVYHNNEAGVQGDPHYAKDYYNYLTGHWKDGVRMEYGGTAYPGQGGTYGPVCDFMFPGNTDICDWGTGGLQPNGPKDWTEESSGNPPGDRRFMQSAGPFTLRPGAVNYITVGIPWARATDGGPMASVRKLQVVDDKCQQLFDNCFKVITGPNAPDLTLRELDKAIIIYISNRRTPDDGNNFNEKYVEYDPRIQSPNDSISWDSLYRFEGYQIFQLKDATVTVADIKNVDKARPVFQCDLKNDVSSIINYYYNADLNSNEAYQEVVGENKGIVHSVKITKDAFTNEALVNHKQYYYLALAYAYNNYKPYNPLDPEMLDGQMLPYLAGRKNIRVYTGIPHQNVGLISPKAEYGDGVVITRIAGQGNGGNYLELDESSIEEILSKPMMDSTTNTLGMDTYPIAYNLKYKQGKGPIDVKIIDPLNVKNAEYIVKFDPMQDVRYKFQNKDTLMPVGTWTLTDLSTGTVYHSDTTTIVKNEQLFLDLGLSINIQQSLYFGLYVTNVEVRPEYDTAGNLTGYDYVYTREPQLENNGFLGATMEFEDPAKPYIDFIPDIDGHELFDWIRAGMIKNWDWKAIGNFYDPQGIYEQVLGGKWSPSLLAQSEGYLAPAYAVQSDAMRNQFINTQLSSVDIVLTPDKSKWTRCAVIEMSRAKNQSQGKVEQFELRAHRSLNQNGDTAVVSSDPALNSDFIHPYGMSWFPGYAINVETGERLNIVFGEDSRYPEENGADLLFNPSPLRLDYDYSPVDFPVGGRHYIYIMSPYTGKKAKLGITSPIHPASVFDHPAYDGCAHFVEQITKPAIPVIARQFRAQQLSNAMWVSIPYSTPESGDWLNCDLKIQIRVQKPYERYFSIPMSGAQSENDYWPMYKFTTENVATDYNDVVKAENDLDKIAVVPNPYYGRNQYETDQLDKRVKIVNLPPTCDISIYNTGGNLIRKFSKDDPTISSVTWDLTNYAGIPVAGGVYIIYVKSPQGEKVVKFFGSPNQIDLNAF